MRRKYVSPTTDVVVLTPAPLLGGSNVFLDEEALLGTLNGIEKDVDALEAATRSFFDLNDD
jgi:hypothetical protein